jgi:hypothetical protein
MAPKRTFPPLITASTWGTAYQAAWNAVLKTNGPEYADDGTLAPRLTNRDAAALVRAWSSNAAATTARFPLWYQFAAIAYGWAHDNDTLNTSAKQADALYPTELAKELWLTLHRLELDLDDEGVSNPRLEFDNGWADPMWLAMLRGELQQDGAQAQFKIPTGFCIDTKTGRRRVPRPKCDSKGQGPINPIDPTGPRLPCDKPGDCKSIDIDDPITGIGKKLGKDFAKLAIVVAVAWIVWKETTRQRRTRK